MIRVLSRNWVQIALVLSVFALFIANAGGLFQVAFAVGGGAVTFPAILKSPEFLLLLVAGLALSVFLPVLTPIRASLVTLVAMAPFWYLGYYTTHRPLVPMEYSLLTILMLYAVNVLAAWFRETNEKQKLMATFGRYVPVEVVNLISESPERFTMAGESRELTVMFCDVHDFTSISEQLEPRELAELLNTMFTPLTRIIYRHQGVVDKYMGDAIMAFWGAPLDDPHHAGNAVAAAFEIQEELVEMRVPFAARGWPEIRMGIGINTGSASVGNMGSEYRIAYTAIGDAVNLAARLQDLTRVYRARIIVGERTRRAFPAVTYRELGLVQVKGKESLARIYEPCNPATDLESTIVANMHRHNEALRCYYDRQWDLAERLFDLVKADQPDDPLYDYYLGRIAEFRQSPPSDDWRGEIRYTVK